jgi:hypothetical protein
MRRIPWLLALVIIVASQAALLAKPVTGKEQPKEDKKIADKPHNPLDVQAELAMNDPMDAARNQPAKVYKVKLLKGRTYVVDMRSEAFDTFLRLTDAKDQQLADDDDGGEGTDSQIVFSPTKDEEYKIYATTFDGGLGQFTLKVSQLAYKTGKALKLGENGLKIDGKLDATDAKDQLGQRDHYKIYSVEMKKGSTYTIEMESNNFDTFLRFLGPSFKMLAEDDDGGGGLNSRIQYRVEEDGVYHIIATTYDGDLGNFTLNVKKD